MGTHAAAVCPAMRQGKHRKALLRVALRSAALLLATAAACAQAKPGTGQTPPPAATTHKPDTHITPAQAKELFASVDQILAFASRDSHLAIQHPVQRRLTTRAAVESYVLDKFKEDKDAKRLQRSEIVLKKFGLLDRDFQLQPFLVSLLTEQIAGYYDNKTKTVNLLDWIEPEQQKPVLAHELTHALQDQHVDLQSWGDKTSDVVARNVAEDNKHLETDEADTARDAVAEGQAMAVFIDYSLQPTGKTLLSAPDLLGKLDDQIDESQDSPVLARAPLLLKESLLFPYREGLAFETALMKDEGPVRAFAGVLDRPPNTSYEILHPRAYESRQTVPLLRMPDVHPLLDASYDPYDIGVMGALDVRILTELFGGQNAAASFTPLWDGGLYYAAQRKNASDSEKAGTASVALLYLSQWTSEDAAKQFALLYAKDLNKKYTKVERREEDEGAPEEEIYSTNEGPVVIQITGKQVFVSESFDLNTARKLELLLTGAQTGNNEQTAFAGEHRGSSGAQELSGGLARIFSDCGVMRVALRH